MPASAAIQPVTSAPASWPKRTEMFRVPSADTMRSAPARSKA